MRGIFYLILYFLILCLLSVCAQKDESKWSDYDYNFNYYDDVSKVDSQETVKKESVDQELPDASMSKIEEIINDKLSDPDEEYDYDEVPVLNDPVVNDVSVEDSANNAAIVEDPNDSSVDEDYQIEDNREEFVDSSDSDSVGDDTFFNVPDEDENVDAIPALIEKDEEVNDDIFKETVNILSENSSQMRDNAVNETDALLAEISNKFDSIILVELNKNSESENSESDEISEDTNEEIERLVNQLFGKFVEDSEENINVMSKKLKAIEEDSISDIDYDLSGKLKELADVIKDLKDEYETDDSEEIETNNVEVSPSTDKPSLQSVTDGPNILRSFFVTTLRDVEDYKATALSTSDLGLATESTDVPSNVDQKDAEETIEATANGVVDDESVTYESYSEESADLKDQQNVKIGNSALVEDTKSTTTVDADDVELTSTELNDKMAEFVLRHDLIDTRVQSGDEAERYNLEVGVPVTIEYSSSQSNAVHVWLFEGDGVGIEFNMTELSVSSVMGDFVLVKPGGVDSTADGLIFSYMLRSERKYRFTDVNSLYVRLETRAGFLNRRCTFSVKLMAESPSDEEEPDLEPVLRAPLETLTVYFELPPYQFKEIQPIFHSMLIDMVHLYVTENSIELQDYPEDVANITLVSVCNINWANYDRCVSVTFGAPVQFPEDFEEYRLNGTELEDMWSRYAVREPFRNRLENLGLREFLVPNDSVVLLVWLVIGLGLMLSMAMLAVTLWRWNCFQGYTRMPSFSDTESVKNKKHGLDLYPTPHQDLPPLYYDQYESNYGNDADIGGFTNSSYVRDDMFDLDSDEDELATRAGSHVRNSPISPKDLYQV